MLQHFKVITRYPFRGEKRLSCDGPHVSCSVVAVAQAKAASSRLRPALCSAFASSPGLGRFWVAVKEFKIDFHNSDTILSIIYP